MVKYLIRGELKMAKVNPRELKKGSREAKDYMAMLRSKRKKKK